MGKLDGLTVGPLLTAKMQQQRFNQRARIDPVPASIGGGGFCSGVKSHAGARLGQIAEVRLEQFTEDFFQQGIKRRQAFQFVEQVACAGLLRMGDRCLLILEDITVDGLSGDGNAAFLHQLLAQRNTEKSQQIILLVCTVQSCLQRLRKRLVIAVFFQSVVGRVQKHAVVVRTGAEHETAGQWHGHLLVGVEQNPFGEHGRGLCATQGVARQLYVCEPVEILAVEAVACGQVGLQAGGLQNLGKQQWSSRTGHHRCSERGAIGQGLNSRSVSRSRCGR
ncbi:hypothetical protein [Pseudomonas sp. FR229a]|uniref:hypothetical protein n=1 Tax=Pseudomonas sp. FR229a TaxID=3040313 RepID=UPI002554297E|nr:hypothetical protein [Pseudomonas sp. FR229a]